MGLLHDKCLTRKQHKTDSAFVSQGKNKGKGKFQRKGSSSNAKEASSKGGKDKDKDKDSSKKECTFCDRRGHVEDRFFAKKVVSKKVKVEMESKAKGTSSSTSQD